MNRERFDQLLSLECDGRLDERGRAELERLCAEPKYARLRALQGRIDACLAEEREAGCRPDLADEVLAAIDRGERVHRARLRFPRQLARAAAILLAVGMLGIIGYQTGQRAQAGGGVAENRLEAWRDSWWQDRAPGLRALGFDEATVTRLAEIEVDHQRRRLQLGESPAPAAVRELERKRQKALLEALNEEQREVFRRHTGWTRDEMEAVLGR